MLALDVWVLVLLVEQTPTEAETAPLSRAAAVTMCYLVLGTSIALFGVNGGEQVTVGVPSGVHVPLEKLSR